MLNNDYMIQEIISTEPHCANAFISSNSEPIQKMEILSQPSNVLINIIY